MTIDVSQFHQVFFDESFENVEHMHSLLQELTDGKADADSVNTIFRMAHSIKGGAGTFGFADIADFTQELEKVFDIIRDQKQDITNDILAVCVEAIAVLKEMLTAAQQGTVAEQPHIADVSGKLRQLSAVQAHDSEPQLEKNDTASTHISSTVPTQQAKGWKIYFAPQLEMMRTGNDPLRLLKALNALGNMTVNLHTEKLPAFTELEPEACYLAWDILLEGDISREQIDKTFDWVSYDCELTVEPWLDTSAAADDEAVAVDDDSTAKVDFAAEPLADELPITENDASVDSAPENIVEQVIPSKEFITADNEEYAVRLGETQIENITNLLDDLMMTQTMLTQLGEGFNPQQLPKLLAGLQQLKNNTNALHEGISRMRMLPIDALFNRISSLVDTLKATLGKPVELKLHGAETMLDAVVLARLTEPLSLLIRFVLESGWEFTGQDVEADKPATGLLQIQADQQDGQIIIDITHGGLCLESEKILHQAIENGLVNESTHLSEKATLQLLFLSGFASNEVLGNNLNLASVRKTIQGLGGDIEIKADHGIGLQFIIRLPQTLVLLDGQIVQIAGQKYVVPQSAIMETVEINSSNMKRVAGKGDVYKLHDDYIPLLQLHQLLDLGVDIDETEHAVIIVVQSQDKKLGLVVDDLLSQQQIIVKSLETNYRNVTGLMGATILGEGDVALILDVIELKQLQSENKKSRIEAA